MSTATLEELFPGKMGRVKLSRIAVKLRRPDLLKMAPDAQIDNKLAASLRVALQSIDKG